MEQRVVGLEAADARVGDVTTTEGDAGSTQVKVPIDLAIPPLVRTRIPYTIRPANDGVTDAGDAATVSGKIGRAHV